MAERLEGRTAVITGAGSGIGRAIAEVFAREGAAVAVVDVDTEGADGTVRRLPDTTDAVAYTADVGNLGDMQTVVERIIEHFGRIDILCCNAGIFPSSRLEEMTEQEWDRVQHVNLKGLFCSVKACLPQMIQQEYGRIVATSSITGNITGFPGWAHYGATKAGINGFIRTAAIELARHNITINCVEPGNIMTQGMDDLGEDYIRQTEASIPMGMLGRPEDVAYAMLFLASDEARYITGQSIVVDGGQTLPESRLAMP